MARWKNDNDPWAPLSDDTRTRSDSGSGSKESGVPVPMPTPPPVTLKFEEWDPKNTVMLNKPPINPLHNMIDSERYIKSLETKLERLKKKKNPSSKDIIDSLALFHEDQMRNFVNSDSTILHNTDMIESDRTIIPSYMKRKLFPELQAINATEVAGLVKEDFVEKSFQELSVNNCANLDCDQLNNESGENCVVDEYDTSEKEKEKD